MSAVVKQQLISVEEYLTGELTSTVKHEYLGGEVYAMAGARIAHNVVSGNIFGILHARLRGRPCQPYNSDTKVRVRLPTHVRFYYPDVQVNCRTNPADSSFQDEPTVIFEVLSTATRRIDGGEKKDAYLSIGSLAVYAMVEQDMPLVIVFRRSERGFEREEHAGLGAVIPLPEVGTDLTLAEIYERVEFVPEQDESDE